MLTYAGITLPLPTPALQEWIDSRLPLETIHSPAWDRRARNPKLGSLLWPVGASRWAEGWFIADRARLDLIRKTVYARGRHDPADLVMGDGTGGAGQQRASLYMLPAVPLAGAPGAVDGLWLLPLVDARYWWSSKMTSGYSANSQTWQQTLDAIAILAGTTGDRPVIPDAYLRPSYALDDDWFLPDLVDAAASAIGCRALILPNGTVSWSRPDAARGLLSLESRSQPLVAGGRLDLGPYAKGDSLAALPEAVDVVFPRSDAGTPGVAWTPPVPFSDIAEFRGLATPAPGRRVMIQATAVAYFASSSDTYPTNRAELLKLTQQIARDWYAWRLQSHDFALAGIRAWTPSGLCEVEWHCSQAECYTRVTSPQDQGSCGDCCPPEETAYVARTSSETYGSVPYSPSASPPPGAVVTMDRITSVIPTGSTWGIEGPGTLATSVPFQADGPLILTPQTTSIPADQNNLALPDSPFHILTPTGADRTITGFVLSSRRSPWIKNGSPTYKLTFPHQSGSSTSGNRFYWPHARSVVLGPGEMFQVRQDPEAGFILAQAVPTADGMFRLAQAMQAPAANKVPYLDGSGNGAAGTITAAGLTLIGGADAAAQRTSLSLGTMATQDASAVAITGGSISGVTVSGVPTLYKETTAKTVANTTTETALINGSPTFASSSLAAGSHVRLVIGGVLSMQNVASQQVTLRLKMGSTALGTWTMTSTNLSGVAWRLEILATIATTGSPGTSRWVGWLHSPGSGLGIAVQQGSSTPTTTGDPALGVTAQWNTAAVLNTITQNVCLVEIHY